MVLLWRVWELRLLILFHNRPVFYRTVRFIDQVGVDTVPAEGEGHPDWVPEALLIVREFRLAWEVLQAPEGVARFVHICDPEIRPPVARSFVWEDFVRRIRIIEVRNRAVVVEAVD
jgi:hypothetical protein